MADLLTVTTGTVDCRLVVATNDSIDQEQAFDTVAPQGFVYLTPRRNAFAAAAQPAIVIPDVISLAVNEDGWASMPTETGDPTDTTLIALPAVEGMTWQVSFDLSLPPYAWQGNVKRNRLHVAPFDIPVTAGETTHIADYLPAGVDPSTGTVWVKGDKGEPGPGIADMIEANGELLVSLEDGRTLGPFELPASTEPGPASQLRIGTVTTGPEGSAASATITGTAPEFVLNLTLPRGATGSGGGLPSGGTTNQVPVRAEDGGTAWASVPSLVPGATTTAAGLMSATDKAKLDAAPTTATVTTAQTNAVNTAKTYTDGLVGNQVSTMVTKDQLPMQLTIPCGWNGSTPLLEVTTSQNHTIFTAPFPMEILSLSLIQDRATIATTDINIGVGWRKLANDTAATASTVGWKNTTDEAWTMRRPWSFAGITQNAAARQLATGESLNIAFSPSTNGKYYFPIYCTIKWRPL